MPSKAKVTYWFSILFAVLFLAAVSNSALKSYVPLPILYAYIGLSAILFLRHWRDKSAARKARRRTPEVSLHLNALIGGWPGALIAQQTLRHKSKKGSFRVVLWITVLLNCAAFVWFHTADGQVFIWRLFE